MKRRPETFQRLLLLMVILAGLLTWAGVQATEHRGDTHGKQAHSPAAQKQQADHQQTAAQGAHHGDDHGSEVLHHLEQHLCDSYEVELPGATLHGFIPFSLFGMPMAVTKHVYFLWIVGLLVILLTFLARRSYRDNVPHGRWANFVEGVVLFVRDEIIVPNAGQEGVRYLGFFLTMFIFILFMNLTGLLPWGATATGNISVTAGLAVMAFLLIHWSGIRRYGLKHFANLVPHGVPIALYPILIPIEILGMFTKPFALAMRLFANMLAGHAVITTFLALIPAAGIGLVLIGSAAVAGSVAISLLELFVAFLQAYIFTMLTAIFVGGSLHPH